MGAATTAPSVSASWRRSSALSQIKVRKSPQWSEEMCSGHALFGSEYLRTSGGAPERGVVQRRDGLSVDR